MSEIIKLDESNIISFLKSKDPDLKIGKPFSKQILLIKVCIAGTYYVENILEIEAQLTVGMHLHFFREPENPHDELAVVVKDDKGNKLGYIPKSKNEVLARLMDAGKLVYGKIVEKQVYDDSVEINMHVFMDD